MMMITITTVTPYFQLPSQLKERILPFWPVPNYALGSESFGCKLLAEEMLTITAVAPVCHKSDSEHILHHADECLLKQLGK